MRIALLLALGLLRPATEKGDAIPRGPTPLAKLSTPTLRHHEVLRIDRDFGMAHWEIALDGWLRDHDGQIADVRLWWVNTDEGDRRKPFSAYLRRFIDLGVHRGGEGTLALRLAGDRKEYLFTVALDDAGTPVVYADVELDDGTTVEHCRCERGRLLARRVLGVPVGIGALEVHCTDAKAQAWDARVPYRTIEHGRTYVPE